MKGNKYRILYAVPGVGLDGRELFRRKKILNSIASEKFEFDVKAVSEGPEAIESVYDESMCIPPLLKLLKNYEKDFDGVIIGCYGDPGIEAAREILNIPVVGPGESSMVFATLLGRRFSVVTVLESVFPIIESVAVRVGVSKKMVSVRDANMRVLELGNDTEKSRRKIEEAALRAIKEDGVDTIILGCMSEAFLGLDKLLSEKLEIPIVNPVVSSVKVAESMISSGYLHSRIAYPPKEAILNN
jgi:allantoin racemase